MNSSRTTGDGRDDAPCEDCALVGRRGFLLRAGAAAAGALIALGGVPALAEAAPLEFVTALGGGRQNTTYPIPAKDGAQIDRENETILARWQGKVYCFNLGCPHQNTALRWSDSDTQFECPKHHSRFTPDGTYVPHSGRATRDMDRFAIKRDGNNVVVDLDSLYQDDEDEAAWKAAFVSVS
ncbi:MAG TPA: Rieske 2Fe-2S domain-containing protein [Gemmatimonadaceae bacterium]|nr:Rieske 2Fe-2S domain-containing protein [Gemmatimonadaceae bacterium]